MSIATENPLSQIVVNYEDPASAEAELLDAKYPKWLVLEYAESLTWMVDIPNSTKMFLVRAISLSLPLRYCLLRQRADISAELNVNGI
jgi:hypothetical protein